MPPDAKRPAASKAKRDALLALLADGMRIRPALESLGITNPTWLKWRQRYPVFRHDADRFIREAKHPVTQSVGEQFIVFRKTYFGNDTPEHHAKMIDAITKAKAESITVMLAPPGFAKGLALDTPLPSPDGWLRMGDLVVGDELFDENGNVCRVIYVSDIHHRPCYRLTFDDGMSIVADDEHLWQTTSRQPQERTAVRSTTELAGTLYAQVGRATQRLNHRVAVGQAWELPEADLPLDPYVLGVWLGDGATNSGRITSADSEILDQLRYAGFKPRYISRYDYSIAGLQPLLREVGVFGAKHIPNLYLRGSFKQRLALLQGLVDTDAWVSTKGQIVYTSKLRDLAENVVELVRSLGIKAYITTRMQRLPGRAEKRLYHQANFWPHVDFPIARLTRKAARQSPPSSQESGKHRRVMLTAVDPVPSVPTRCIQVDSPSSLFLAGPNMVTTHNTTLMVDWLCFRIARDPNFRACVISETSSHAEKVLRQIARRMTDEENFGPFIARYGPFKPADREVMKPWNATNLTHVKASHDEKEGSLEAKGFGDQIYGARYDEIWLDDVQSVKTKNLTDQIMEKFSQDIVTRPMDNGRIYDIGTRVAQDDFHERLMTENEDGHRLAQTVLTLPAYNHKGEPLWPELWPAERLEKRRANIASKEIWARVYMQRPVSAEDATFTEDMIRSALDIERPLGRHHGDGVVVFGVDPALVGWTVIMTAHLTPDRLEILDMMRRRNCSSNETIMRLIEEQARRYRPRTGIFELANYQGALFNDTRLAGIAGQYGFWTKPHTTAGRKADPQLGVRAMDTTFIRGEISIPWGDDQARATMAPLVEELRRWRGDVPTRQLTQDTVMALWFIHRHWMLEVRSALRVVEPYKLRTPTWLTRTRSA